VTGLLREMEMRYSWPRAPWNDRTPEQAGADMRYTMENFYTKGLKVVVPEPAP
jgi:hypothetical protein